MAIRTAMRCGTLVKFPVALSGFSTLADEVNQRVAAIIETASKASESTMADTEKRKISDLYASYLDTEAINAAGTDAVKPHLAAIAAIGTQQQLATALGKTLRADVDAREVV